MMILASKPYLEADALKDVQELRTRKMLQEHKAWFSLDLVGDISEKPGAEQDAAMTRIIRLAAEMVDKNTVGVLLPSENIVLPISEEVITAMKEADALKALRKSSNAAVIGSSGDDPVWVKDLKLGDEVKMKISQLSDWMYLKDGEIIGGYTVKVLMDKQKQEEK